MTTVSLRRQRKSLSVTFLIALVLLFTTINGIRLGSALASWDILNEFSSGPGALYIALTGGLWFFCGLCMIVLILKRPRAGVNLVTMSALLYTIYFWLDNLLIQQSSARANTAFSLGLTVLLLVIFFSTVRQVKKSLLRY